MIDLTKLNKIHAELERNILNTFKSIPVRVDHELQGCEYYISVSPELCEKLKKAKGD